MEKQGHSASIAPGEHSQFDVVSDGELLFSKLATGRFPELDEILAKLG